MTSVKEQLKGFFNINNINFNCVKINGKPYPFDINNFEKREFIGSSQHSVYAYEHKLTKKIVAAKLIRLPSDNAIIQDKELKFKRISREIKHHQDLLDCSHIVDFYGVCFGFDKNDLIIFMEKMDMTLKFLYDKVHRDYGYFPEKLLGNIAVAMVKVGSYCKEKNIMHRDLKPHNILVNNSGEIKLCDFGESILLENSEALSRVGTIQYWPPEHFDPKYAEDPYNVTVDVWSLGIILLELIRGKFPIDYSSSRAIMIQHELRNLQANAFVSKFFKEIVEFYFTNHAKDFILKCLQPVKNRPKFNALKDTSLYREYDAHDLRFAVKKEMDLISNKQYFCLQCAKTLSGWEQWEIHFKKQHPNNLREFSSLPTNMPSTSRNFRSEIIPPDPIQKFPSAPTKINILNVSKVSTNNSGSEFPKKCDICDIISTSQKEWDIHIAGEKHRKKSAPKSLDLNSNKSTQIQVTKSLGSSPSKPKSEFYCKECDVTSTSQQDYEIHLKGEKHRKKCHAKSLGLGINSSKGAQEKQQTIGASTSSNKPKSVFYCKICEKDCENPGAYKSHIDGEKHKKKFNQLKSNP